MFGRNNRKTYFHSGYVQQMNTFNPHYQMGQAPYGGFTSPSSFQPHFSSIQNQPNTFPIYQQQYPQAQGYLNGPSQMNSPYQPKPNFYNESQFLFQNPLQPKDDLLHPHYQQQMYTIPQANPYPKPAALAQQPSGVKSIMNSFKGQDGSVDLNKMMDTAGQMMNAVNQVSSLVKGLGGIFKV